MDFMKWVFWGYKYLSFFFLLDPADKGIDEEPVLMSLHNLYALAELPIGRDAIINVLGLEDNLKVLLPFINLKGNSYAFLFFVSL